jgi:hypothetical protein
VHGAKVGAFARREKKSYLQQGHSPDEANARFGTLEAVKKYLEDVDLPIDDPEVLRSYSDSKAVQDFIEEHGLDQQLKTALQKQLSRAKRSR